MSDQFAPKITDVDQARAQAAEELLRLNAHLQQWRRSPGDPSMRAIFSRQADIAYIASMAYEEIAERHVAAINATSNAPGQES